MPVIPLFVRRVSAILASIALLLLFSGQQEMSFEGPGSTLLRQGRSLWAQGYYDSAFSIFTRAQAEAEIRKDTLTLAETLRQRGKYYARHGYPDQAEATLDSAIALSGVLGPLYAEVILARCERADVEGLRGDMATRAALYAEIVADCADLTPARDSLRAIVLQWAAQAYMANDQLDSAELLARRSFDIFTRILPEGHLELGYAANTLGILCVYADKRDEAVKHLEYTLQIFSRKLRPAHSNTTQVRSNLASVCLDMGLPWEALKLLGANLQHLDSISPAAQFSTLYNYATTRTMVGDYHEALAYLDRLDLLLKEKPGLRPDGFGLVCYERAAAYQSLQEYDLALKYISEGITRNESLFGKDHSQHTMDYLRKGTILSKMGRYEESITAMQSALRLAEKHMEPLAMRKGWILEALGEVYLKKGDARQALQYFRKSEQMFQKLETRWNLAETYSQVAQAWRMLGQADSNAYFLRRAWEEALPELPFQSAPDSQVYAYWHRTQLMPVLKEQGESMLWRGTRNEAFSCYKACIALSDSQSYYFEAPGSKVARNRERTALTEKILRMGRLDTGLSEDRKGWVEEAFYIAESSKAYLLREHLRGQEALHFSGVPDSLIEKELYYRQRIASLPQAGSGEEMTDEEWAATQKTLFDLTQAYRGLLHRLETQYPEYYRLKYPDASFRLAALKKQIAPSQAMYSYFLGDSALYIFRLYKGELLLYTDHAWEEESVERWLSFISSPPRSDSAYHYEKVARDAYHPHYSLLPELNEDITQILIIPSGKLANLPFESLLKQMPQGPDYREWEFLGKNISFTYAYSAELWLQEQKQTAGSWASYIGFAPEFGAEGTNDARSRPGPLRFNQEEVTLSAKAMKGQSFMGKQAGEKEIKALAGKNALLHLATHAIADEERPMQSRLYFAADSASGEDGILYAHEMYGLQINSPLTVLSACQTGKGPLVQGEGVMSLARAFQYAGSRQVVTTLWKTDDHAGATLVSSFFQQLSEGKRSEDALKEARKHYFLQSDPYHAHPYFWAGMVLIGSGEAVRSAPLSAFHWTLIFIGMLLAGMLGYIQWQKRQRSKVTVPFLSGTPGPGEK
ncbi:MAG: CHAT domain-containing protein [Bacteroidetes bacterium]|nr:MAG: CHAT domain-containing protein [Bacteroidota bacterium]